MTWKARYAVLLQFIILVSYANAQHIKAVKDPNLPYQFLVHYPEGYNENSNKKYPLLVYLHGRSIQGTDIERVKTYGVLYQIIKGLAIDFIVVAPQCQSGWDNNKLLEVLNYAETKFPVDQERVYLTGMSMGGYGCWQFAGAYPERFAAIAPVCGGGNLKDAKKLKNLPHWVFHGALDKPVPIEESEKMIRAIRAEGNQKIEYSRFENWGHGEVHVVFGKKELYDWFLQYKKSEIHGNTKSVQVKTEVQNTAQKEVPQNKIDPIELKPVQKPLVDNQTFRKVEIEVNGQKKVLKPVTSYSKSNKEPIENKAIIEKDYINFDAP